ncbi:inner-membrane translocator [Micromonospora sp. ATCC 39149]|nr:inner-membrane translocator [Micromonospora sp. ATCC 39149]
MDLGGPRLRPELPLARPRPADPRAGGRPGRGGGRLGGDRGDRGAGRLPAVAPAQRTAAGLPHHRDRRVVRARRILRHRHRTGAVRYADADPRRDGFHRVRRGRHQHPAAHPRRHAGDDDRPGPVREPQPAWPRHPGGGPGRGHGRPDGREQEPGDPAGLRARWPDGRRRGPAVERPVRLHEVQRGLPDRAEGIRRGGPRRYRQPARRAARRPAARGGGKLRRRPVRWRLEGLHRLRAADRAADVPAHRPARRISREGARMTATVDKGRSPALKGRWAAMPKQVRWAAIAALIVLLYILPNRWFYEYLGFPIGSEYFAFYTTRSDFAGVLFDTAVFVLLAVGLNVVVGFAGLLDLGYFGFYALGAYTVALLTSPESRLGTNWPWLAAVPIAVMVAMISGVILGGPTLRLRGDYLAIVTLGFAEMIRLYAARNEGVLQGQRGIPAIPHPPGTGSDGKPLFGVVDARPYYWLLLTLILLVIVLVRNLANSRVGRAWVATREDEDAAEVMGVPTFKYKLWAFAIGAAVAGLTGAVFAGKQTFINSDQFVLESSILVLAAVILGGAGNIKGAIVGGAITWYLPEWLRGVGDLVGVEFDAAEYRILVFGLVIIVMMIFRPQGIVPNRRRAAEFADRRQEAVPQEKVPSE